MRQSAAKSSARSLSLGALGARYALRTLRVALLVATTGCHPRSVSTPAPSTAAAPLHRGPLTDYVPAAGLRWLLAGRPQELARSPELLAEVQSMLSSARLDTFATSSGVELRELPEGCIAGFDYGTLYLARVGSNTPTVRKRFETRLITDPVVRSSRSGLWRVTGLVANTPESLLVVDNDFTAVAVGDPLLARVAEAFALGRFKKSKPALAGAALASLPVDLQNAPLRFYAPGPFTNEWARAADGVLARAMALGASASLATSSVLRIRLVLSGAFAADQEKTRSQLLSAWEHLQVSTIGHLLRLQETLEPATVSVADDAATLTVSFAVSTLMKGVSAAVIDDVDRMMGSLPPEPAGPVRSE